MCLTVDYCQTAKWMVQVESSRKPAAKAKTTTKDMGKIKGLWPHGQWGFECYSRIVTLAPFIVIVTIAKVSRIKIYNGLLSPA